MNSDHLNKFPQVPPTYFPSGSGIEVGSVVKGYEIKEWLGGGAQGQAFLAVKGSRKYVLKKTQIKDSGKGDMLIKLAADEAEKLRTLTHENIVRIQDTPFRTDNNIYIVTDYYKDGDLVKYIKNKGNLTEQKAAKFLKQIVKGLQYAAEQGIIHCDIKPENIFIDNDNAIIGDFGIAIEHKDSSRSEVCSGTPPYISPELVANRQIKPSPARDIWALGITMYLAIFGHDPANQLKLDKGGFSFDGTVSPLSERPKISGENLKFPSDPRIQDQFKNILRGMLTYDSGQRWSYKEILEELEKLRFGQAEIASFVLNRYDVQKPNSDKFFSSDEFFSVIPNTIKKFIEKNAKANANKQDLGLLLERDKTMIDMYLQITNEMLIFADKPEVQKVSVCLKMLAGLCLKGLNQRASKIKDKLGRRFSNDDKLYFDDLNTQNESIREYLHPIIQKGLPQQHHKRNEIIIIFSGKTTAHDQKIPIFIGEGLFFMFRFSERVSGMFQNKAGQFEYVWDKSKIMDWKRNLVYTCLLHLLERIDTEYCLNSDTYDLEQLLGQLVYEDESTFSKLFIKSEADNRKWKDFHVGV